MSNKSVKFTLSEDWWAVITAFILIALVAIAQAFKLHLPIKF